MGNFKALTFVLLAGTFMTAAASAADMEAALARAVAEPNGKIEIGGGWADLDSFGTDTSYYGAGSFSIPLGDTFGAQVDFAATHMFGETAVGGAAHVFTRNPDSYLLGAYGGYADFGNASGAWIGPEAEVYLGNISLEATGGYFNVNPDIGASQDKAFAFVDAGLYATDNLRFTVGASSVAGFESAHAGMEWLLTDVGMPLSFKTNAQIGEDHFYNLTAGLSFYFGGPDKSLIRRHREDDPRNRVLDLFSSGGVAIAKKLGGAPGPLPACIYDFETALPINEPCVDTEE